VWLGTIGFIDDYIKVFKKDKRGLAGKFKVVGQVGVGIIIGPRCISIRRSAPGGSAASVASQLDERELHTVTEDDGTVHYLLNRKSPNTTIPFVKDNEFNYSSVLGLFGRQCAAVHLDALHSGGDLHHHRRQQRSQHHRWSRWPGHGHLAIMVMTLGSSRT
jgi:hypothetical protein